MKRMMMLFGMMLASCAAMADTQVVDGIEWTYEIKGGKATIVSGSGYSAAIPLETTGTITIPSTLGGYSVTSIGEGAFEYCSRLTDIVIPSSVVSIGDNAFHSCSGLRSMMIPEGVTSVGALAFYYCDSLTKVEIPASVTSIGHDAFAFCKSLTEISVAQGSKHYAAEGGVLFNKSKTELVACPGAKSGHYEIPSGVTSIGVAAFIACKSLTGVSIPATCKDIHERAFRCCDGLTSIIIPSGVSSIEDRVFSSCDSLSAFSVAKGNGHFAAEDGVLFNKAKTEIVAYPCARAGQYVIPSGVKSIAGAFQGCRGLTSVTIPSSVTSIEERSFSGCSALISVTMPSSVTSIGERSFDGCSALIGVTMPSSVTSIGDYAFFFCDNLETIYVDKGDTARVKKMVEDAHQYYDVSGIRYVEVENGSEDPVGPVVPDDPEEEDPIDYEPMDASVANTYDGVVYDAKGLPIGTVTVKTAKASGKGEAQTSKLTVTVQMAGEAKKVSITGSLKVADAIATLTAKDGRELELMFTHNTIYGTFDGYEVAGSRNLFASKVTSEKADANEVLNEWKGSYILAFEDENGWNGLSVGIAAQGKVKVSGKLADGTSVSVTSQLVIGDETSTVPVIYTKKDVSLAFAITLANDGSEMGVTSSYDAIISQVGNIDSGLSFRLGDDFCRLYDDVELLDFLPDGVSVEPSGTKWIVADGEKKAGKIVIDKDTGDVCDTNESANPSGLKLTYAAKTGTFKGSFKVYYLSNGKVKSDSATVTGFVVDGIGYGTVTVKKRGSASVSIE